MQEKMGKEMGEMMKDGKGKPGSKELAKLAAEQAALRKKMRDLQKQLEKEGNGKKLGDLQCPFPVHPLAIFFETKPCCGFV